MNTHTIRRYDKNEHDHYFNPKVRQPHLSPPPARPLTGHYLVQIPLTPTLTLTLTLTLTSHLSPLTSHLSPLTLTLTLTLCKRPQQYPTKPTKVNLLPYLAKHFDAEVRPACIGLGRGLYANMTGADSRKIPVKMPPLCAALAPPIGAARWNELRAMGGGAGPKSISTAAGCWGLDQGLD